MSRPLGMNCHLLFDSTSSLFRLLVHFLAFSTPLINTALISIISPCLWANTLDILLVDVDVGYKLVGMVFSPSLHSI